MNPTTLSDVRISGFHMFCRFGWRQATHASSHARRHERTDTILASIVKFGYENKYRPKSQVSVNRSTNTPWDSHGRCHYETAFGDWNQESGTNR